MFFREQSNNDIAIFSGFIDNVNVTWVHDISDHAEINSFCRIKLFYTFILTRIVAIPIYHVTEIRYCICLRIIK